MGKDIHLVLRFNFDYHINPNLGSNTVRAHQKVIEKRGSVWWGVSVTPRLEVLNRIDQQLFENRPIYAFLYESGTPKRFSETGHRWFLATVIDAVSGPPEDLQYIPEHYRHENIASAFFRFRSIKEIQYKTDDFPKLQAQNPMRYAVLEGTPRPENLRLHKDPSRPVARVPEKKDTLEDFKKTESTVIVSSDKTENLQTLSARVIHLQDDIIGLQDQMIELQAENSELRAYKERYDRIRDLESIFSDEKAFESWLERNMHRIAPRLEVIDRQIYGSWPDGKFGRQDMFCMDKETRELVIVEVKTRKRKVSTAYDQYLRYTTYARRNLDEINQKYGDRGLRATKNLEFMIITDFVTDEMVAICEDRNIELVKLFGGIGIEFPRAE